MKKYETVVFDLDGTLLNTLEDLADATNYALRTMQMPERTIGEVRAFVGNGVRRLMELSVPGGFDNPKFEETFAVFKKYYGEHCNDKTRAYDGVVPVLRKLKEKGYALAIVSNKIDFAVKELNEIYFEGIVQAAMGSAKVWRENQRRIWCTRRLQNLENRRIRQSTSVIRMWMS